MVEIPPLASSLVVYDGVLPMVHEHHASATCDRWPLTRTSTHEICALQARVQYCTPARRHTRSVPSGKELDRDSICGSTEDVQYLRRNLVPIEQDLTSMIRKRGDKAVSGLSFQIPSPELPHPGFYQVSRAPCSFKMSKMKQSNQNQQKRNSSQCASSIRNVLPHGCV